MESLTRRHLPTILLFITAFISLTPVPFLGNASTMPCLPLITVFFWSLLRPAYLPVLAIFIAGLLVDAFAAPALGMYALILLLMRLLTRWFVGHFFRQTVWFYWGGFWLMSLPCWLAYWILSGIVSGHVLSILPALGQWGLTALCYPLLHLVFTRCLAILPHSR